MVLVGCNVHIVATTTTGRQAMAERKSALKRAPARPELDQLVEQSKEAGVSEDVLHEQRISFVYGNAPKGSRITKESAKQAAQSIKVAR
jgi:hypothetical protein